MDVPIILRVKMIDFVAIFLKLITLAHFTKHAKILFVIVKVLRNILHIDECFPVSL